MPCPGQLFPLAVPELHSSKINWPLVSITFLWVLWAVLAKWWNLRRRVWEPLTYSPSFRRTGIKLGLQLASWDGGDRLQPPICVQSVRSPGNSLGWWLVAEVGVGRRGRLAGLSPQPEENHAASQNWAALQDNQLACFSVRGTPQNPTTVKSGPRT